MRTIVLASLLLFASTAVAAPGDGKKSLGYEHLRNPAPEVGTQAPDFTLKTLEGGETVQLSSFVGERPVALVFGSYT